MRDDEVFHEAMRAEDWTHLAGNGAAARARSVALRRTRYAGIAGATAAVAVGAVVVGGVFGSGAGRPTPASGPVTAVSLASPGSPGTPSGAAATTASQGSGKYPAGTMGAVYERWKTCPDEELRVLNFLPTDPKDLQQRWRDACHRDMATLTALLPGYEITPDLTGMSTPPDDPGHPGAFRDPSFVLPPGYKPTMGPTDYRVVDESGGTTRISICAFGRDDHTKPGQGENVTLPNGLTGWLTLGTDERQGSPLYELYVQDKGRTFYVAAAGVPDFDFTALVTSPKMSALITAAMARPESS